jgi:hypothetical protein
MIAGYLIGGLGNQLFIIFTVISYAIKYNISYTFPCFPRSCDRPFYFDTFLSDLKHSLVKITPEQLTFRKYQETELFVYSTIPRYSKDFCIHGYFQNVNYFDENKEKILNIIGFHKQVEIVKEKYNKYQGYDCSLHFRIGDAKVNTGFIILDIEYYIDALKSLNGIRSVLYFYEEEDILEVEKKIRILWAEFPEITFTAIDTSIPDYQQMILMSLCKNNIIANSTFSWWGAYLNTNQNTNQNTNKNTNQNNKVCYPSKYFQTHNITCEKNVKQLFLPSWKCIEI